VNQPCKNKIQIQNLQYEFPYHYIPHFHLNGTPSLIRKLTWGFDYLCYQNHIKEKVLLMSPESVLEVGCGDGYFIGGLSSAISLRVGVDLSAKAIAFAKAFHPDCTFYCCDTGEVKEQFDIIFAIEVLEHIHELDLNRFFCTLANRLKNDGKVVISVPSTVVQLNEKHYRHYTSELLKQHIDQSGSGLYVIDIEYIYSNPWWFRFFKLFFDNRLFSLEVKPFMKLAWRQIWHHYRFANEKNGYHIVATLTNCHSENKSQ